MNFVERVHRGNHAFVNRAVHRFRRTFNCFFNKRLFFFKKPAKHIIDRRFVRRSTDTDAKGKKINSTQVYDKQ